MPEPRCTHCGASITEPYNIDYTWMVVCQSCQTPHFLWVFDRAYRKIPKPWFNLTRRFNIDQKPDGVAIRYRKMRSTELFIFSGFWFALFLIAFGGEIQLVFHLILIPTSIVCGYVLAEEIVNRKTVLLMAKHIEISEGPLPSLRQIIQSSPLASRVGRILPQFIEGDLSRRQIIDISDIKQVYCAEHTYRGDDGDVTTFDVQLKRKSGSDILLIKGLDTHKEALFIQCGIEQLYQIEAKPKIN